jgi:hypothetical protein
MPILEINGTDIQKNNRGTLGPICDYCGGYGFTNMLSDKGGSSAGCSRCGGTGVEQPTPAELQNQINTIMLELKGLKNLIIKEAKRRI